MGRKVGWFSAVKKVLIPESKKDQKNQKSTKNDDDEHEDLEPTLSPKEAVDPALPPVEDTKLIEAEAEDEQSKRDYSVALATAAAAEAEDEQSKHDYSVALATAAAAEAEAEQSKHAYAVALATAAAAEAAVAAVQAAAEVIRLTSVVRYPGKTTEEIAAIKIQTAFRGYLARRASRALRGLVRLKTLIQGQSVKRQGATTLRCMQTLARVQSQIHARRIRMSEENQALQRQLQRKCEKEVEKLRAAQVEEEWNASSQSKEQLQARLLNRQEAAMRRQKALAYASSHQQTRKNSSKSVNPTFMDSNNSLWGWSWLERWMAARPWESQPAMDHINNRASVKSATSHAMSVGEITKLYSLRDRNPENKPSSSGQKSSRPPSHQSPSTPASKASSASSAAGKARRTSSRGSTSGSDDESRSMFSVQSGRHRRHSIGGSSARDDDSHASSPAFPRLTSPPQSTKTKSRTSPSAVDKIGTPEKGRSVDSAKKRLPTSASQAGSRRHSGPPKVETFSKKDVAAVAEEKVGNGGGR